MIAEFSLFLSLSLPLPLHLDVFSSPLEPVCQQPGIVPVDEFEKQYRLLELAKQHELLSAEHYQLSYRKRLVLPKHELSDTKSKIII